MDLTYSSWNSLDGDQPVARLLPTQDNTNTKKRGQAAMSRVGSEPMIKVFERTRTFHALHRAATVIGIYLFKHRIGFQIISFRILWSLVYA
jgi:hypothetical protein